MTLGPSSSGSRPGCPFQQGMMSGTKNGASVQANVEYLIDTGADFATVWAATGSRFDVRPTGFSASPTTGGGGMQVVTGITAHFTVEDSSGNAQQVTSSRYVVIKSTNNGTELLGMAQIADVQADVRWDPNANSGSLRIKSPTSTGSQIQQQAGSAQMQQQSAGSAQQENPVFEDHETWIRLGDVRLRTDDPGLLDRAGTKDALDALLEKWIDVVRKMVATWRQVAGNQEHGVKVDHWLLRELETAVNEGPYIAWPAVRSAFNRAIGISQGASTADLESTLKQQLYAQNASLEVLLSTLLRDEIDATKRFRQSLQTYMRAGTVTFEPADALQERLLGGVVS
jgi:hypothetical protein